MSEILGEADRCSTRQAMTLTGTRAAGSASPSQSATSTASSTTSTTSAPGLRWRPRSVGPERARGVHDCLFYDWRWRQPPTGALNFRDFSLPNSLRHEVVEPMQRYRLSSSELGLDLNLQWSALMAPHVLGDASWEHCHFDQPGRMQGTATLNGEHFEVDSYSMRDRTWGPHRPGARRSGDDLWAIAGAETHWHPRARCEPSFAGWVGRAG